MKVLDVVRVLENPRILPRRGLKFTSWEATESRTWDSDRVERFVVRGHCTVFEVECVELRFDADTGEELVFTEFTRSVPLPASNAVTRVRDAGDNHDEVTVVIPGDKCTVVVPGDEVGVID